MDLIYINLLYTQMTLKQKARKYTQMKFYKVMAVPAFRVMSEMWTLTPEDKQRTQSARMKFLKRTKGCQIKGRMKTSEPA